MTTRTLVTIEEPVEFNLAAILEHNSVRVIRNKGELPTGEEIFHSTMRRSPQHIYVGELPDDAQRVNEFLASIEAPTNKS